MRKPLFVMLSAANGLRMTRTTGGETMADLKLACAIRDYDHIAPLRTGDVTPEGIDLAFDFGPDVLNRVINLPEVAVGELSFGRYLIRLASGDDSIVGLPVFPTCLFRH